jgi:hypothetical protein
MAGIGSDPRAAAPSGPAGHTNIRDADGRNHRAPCLPVVRAHAQVSSRRGRCTFPSFFASSCQAHGLRNAGVWHCHCSCLPSDRKRRVVFSATEALTCIEASVAACTAREGGRDGQVGPRFFNTRGGPRSHARTRYRGRATPVEQLARRSECRLSQNEHARRACGKRIGPRPDHRAPRTDRPSCRQRATGRGQRSLVRW